MNRDLRREPHMDRVNGLPLLLPYAWLAFGAMCVTITAAMVVAKLMRPTEG